MTFFSFRAKRGKKLLEKTLEDMGKRPSPKGLRVLNYSLAEDTKQRDKVHLDTNLLIKQSLETNSLGECIHITGRMSALNDPFHADLCTAIFRETDNPFKFSYFDQDEPDRDALSIVKQKHTMWSSKGWNRSLSALRKESHSEIEAFAVRQATPIQYTVFGHKYVQLQSPHDDNGGQEVNKHVWLIESEELYGQFLADAERTLKTATHISPNLFREAYNLIAGFAGKAILKNLLAVDAMEIQWQTALNVASDFHEDPAKVVEALQEFEFVEVSQGEKLKILPNGIQLASALN